MYTYMFFKCCKRNVFMKRKRDREKKMGTNAPGTATKQCKVWHFHLWYFIIRWIHVVIRLIHGMSFVCFAIIAYNLSICAPRVDIFSSLREDATFILMPSVSFKNSSLQWALLPLSEMRYLSADFFPFFGSRCRGKSSSHFCGMRKNLFFHSFHRRMIVRQS